MYASYEQPNVLSFLSPLSIHPHTTRHDPKTKSNWWKAFYASNGCWILRTTFHLSFSVSIFASNPIIPFLKFCSSITVPRRPHVQAYTCPPSDSDESPSTPLPQYSSQAFPRKFAYSHFYSIVHLIHLDNQSSSRKTPTYFPKALKKSQLRSACQE